MTNTILIAVFAVIFPVAVFWAGSMWMTKVTVGDWKKNDRPPLGLSFAGYKVDTIRNYWGRISRNDLMAEQKFLQLDLIFAFAYSSAIALSLVVLWMWLGPNFNPAWLLAPVVLTLVADLVENGLLLSQIGPTLGGGINTVNDGALRAASFATIVKLWSGAVATILLISLAGWLIVAGLTGRALPE